MKRRWIAVAAIVLVVAGIGVGGWLYLRANPELWQQILTVTGLAPVDTQNVTASGFIEAEEVTLAAEIGGRIAALQAAEGDDVPVGQELVQLDTTMLDAQITLAAAAVDVAAAELAEARAGARPEQIQQAEAAVAVAEATLDGAYQAWQDAVQIRDNPQELTVQIAQARARVEMAEAAVRQAEAQKDAAEIGYDAFYDAQEAIDEIQEKWSKLPEDQRPPKPRLQTQIDFHLIPNEYWQAWVALNTAKAELEAAQTALADLVRARENPQQLEAAADAAEARYEAAQATVNRAKASLDLVRSGATEQHIAALEAKVRQAQAALSTLDQQKEKLTLTAPVGGLVLETSLQPGELAAPGTPIVVLGNLDEVQLTVYVPVVRLGDVQLEQTVEVRADAFPERVFAGEVVAIASDAEFTPRNIQSPDERVHMVFAVEIRVPNPDHELKPGGYATATILTEGE